MEFQIGAKPHVGTRLLTIIVRESRVSVCVFRLPLDLKKPLGEKFAFSERRPHSSSRRRAAPRARVPLNARRSLSVGSAEVTKMSPRKGGAKAARGHGHVSGKEKPPITAPGRALFAVVLSPRDLDPEDARYGHRWTSPWTSPPHGRINTGPTSRVLPFTAGLRSRDAHTAPTSPRRHSRLFPLHAERRAS